MRERERRGEETQITQTGEGSVCSEVLTAQALRERFREAADYYERELRLGGLRLTLCFLDGLCAGDAIAEQLLRPLAQMGALSAPAAADGRPEPKEADELLRALVGGALSCPTAEAVTDPDAAAQKLLAGCCLLLVPGAGAAAFELKTGEKRGISEPEVESTTRGPKDAFTETLRTNTSLLRRHLASPALRLYETTLGSVSRTAVCLVWLEGAAEPELVRRMRRRLDTVQTRDLLTPAAVETVLTGRRATPFPLLQYTERTDKFAGALLDGRVGLLVSGLPVGYLAPVNLGWLLEAAEDKDTDRLSARFLHLLRLGALLIALLLPGLYVAMAEFHQEMLPTPLLLAIIESKKNVPFPTVLEVLGLLLAFELLQEAGLSAPKAVSQPVSIIGGLVVGTAAVEANLISPAALIAVSAAGICGFALPGKSFADAVRLCRLALTVCAALAGLFALSWGLIALLIHLAGLDSFGRPYLAPYASLRKRAK